MLQGKREGDHPSHRVPDEDEPVHAEPVEQCKYLTGQSADRVRVRCDITVTVSTEVEADDPVLTREVAQLVVPAMPVSRPAVDEHQRDPVATTDVVVGEPHPVDIEPRHRPSQSANPGTVTAR